MNIQCSWGSALRSSPNSKLKISSSGTKIKLYTPRATNDTGSELRLDPCNRWILPWMMPMEVNDLDLRKERTQTTRVHHVDIDSEMEEEEEAPEEVKTSNAAVTAYLERIFFEKFEAIHSMVERLPGEAPPIRRTDPNSYADTPSMEEIASIERPHKFSFPTMAMYDGTNNPDNYVAQYKQCMLTVAIRKELKEATMCKGFSSTLSGPVLQWYINLPIGFIRYFASLSDQFVEQFAISRSLEKSSDDLYEIL